MPGSTACAGPDDERGDDAADRRRADVPEAKADLLHAVYERMVVTGRTIVSISPTPSAYAHGLALALSDNVAMARPAGFEPAT